MAVRQLPDAETLRKLLRYAPDTGKLYWLPRTPDMFEGAKAPAKTCASWNGRFAGKLAGGPDTYGHIQVTIFWRPFAAHRLIWWMVTGEVPPQIDHINGNPADNRFSNLRACGHKENTRNKKRESRNRSGVTGVSYRSDLGQWRARIKVDGKDISLGHYGTKAEAQQARLAADRRFGFHPNHGRGA